MDENVGSLTLAVDLCKAREWDVRLANPDPCPKGMVDADVIRSCAQRNWSVITLDEMRYTPETCRVIAATGARVFKVVGSKNKHEVHVLGALMAAQARILRILSEDKGPFIAHVHLNGSVAIMSRLTKEIEQNKITPMTESQERTFRKFGTTVSDKLF